MFNSWAFEPVKFAPKVLTGHWIVKGEHSGMIEEGLTQIGPRKVYSGQIDLAKVSSLKDPLKTAPLPEVLDKIDSDPLTGQRIDSGKTVA